MNIKLIAAAFFSLIILFHYTAKTNLAEAPAGHSGAPGEGNCTSCHAGQPISQAPNLMASFSQYNLPVQTLFRGQTYQVKVRLTGLNHNYGFQFSAKNPATGLPVGFFNTFSGTSPIGSSIQQNQFGTTSNTPQGREWSFEFVTPSTYTGDSIVFYVAGMLGNQDGQVTGDQVLLQSYRFAVSSGTPPTPPAISIINSPSQVCKGSITPCAFAASGTLDTTRWLFLEFIDSTSAIITLDSVRARPTNQGQFNINPNQLPLGNYFIRIIERGTNTVSLTRPITILGIDTPKLNYDIIYNSSTGGTNIPTIKLMNGIKTHHAYQWSFNGSSITVPTNADFTPANPFGFYRVNATHQLCPNIPAVTAEYEYTPFIPTFNMGHVCLPFFQCLSFPLIRNRIYNQRTRFILQLSDSTGNFNDSSFVIYSGSLQNSHNAFFWWGLPNNLNPNGQYRLRGKTTSPNYYSPEYSLFTVSHTPNTPIIVDNNGILEVTNPSANVQWEKKGFGVVPQANGTTFQPLTSGIYYARHYDNFCTSNLSNEISIIFTSTQEVSLPIRLSPNPAHQEVILESDQDLDYSQITLLDINGRMLQPVFHQVTPNRIRIETSALPNGLYVLQHQNQRAKLVVQH